MPLSDIVEAALADRIRTCVGFGMCTCPADSTDATCPCHGFEQVVLSPQEAAVASPVIETERSREIKEATTEGAGNDGT